MWILLVVGALILFGIMAYNSLVRLRERADGAWSDIDVQLKRRYDLVPNLVETVKGYASHEQETLERVIQARNRAIGASGPADQAQAENVLTGALRQLFALAESYPQLQAAGGFRDLQGQLSDIEEKISQARRYYNAVVRDYNSKLKTIPTNLVANAFNFETREYFEMDEAERAAPKVDFS
ncbi:MAG: LemA family protein [Gemmatimonadota bacterium]|nr:LemA family protein [Gemmatimonadota bacterium]